MTLPLPSGERAGVRGQSCLTLALLSLAARPTPPHQSSPLHGEEDNA
ncbi:hypothetical protein SAMN04487785_1038 [Dyella jiangningensis]|nr:hypothetical protein BDW41_101575 [Dyella sp. AtDHG13]SDJ62484.1 hypothetical protein SAMN04487785_1038 [Dyella jiangningensis]